MLCLRACTPTTPLRARAGGPAAAELRGIPRQGGRTGWDLEDGGWEVRNGRVSAGPGEILREQAVERALGTRPAGRRRSGIRTPARCSLVVGPGRMRLRTKRAPRSGDGLPNLTSSSSFSNVCVRDVFFVECWCARCVRLHGWFVWSCTVLDGVRACSCACLVCGCLGRGRGTMSFTSLQHTNAVVPSGDICNYTDMSAATRARL